MGIDLRLTGTMLVIAYVAYVSIGHVFSPLATSRRQARNLQIWYARSIAIVVALSGLLSSFVSTASLSAGIGLALSTALTPLALLSLIFSAIVLKRLYLSWKEQHRPRKRRRRTRHSHISLDDLRGQGIQAEPLTHTSSEPVLSDDQSRESPESGSSERQAEIIFADSEQPQNADELEMPVLAQERSA